MQALKRDTGLSHWDVIYAVDMAIACLISYWAITYSLAKIVGTADDYLGGMWAVIATVFVFRDTRATSMSAGLSRLTATCVSFALCLAYLSIFPFTPEGMVVLLALGSIVMAAFGRHDDIITTAITTTVVMVVAAISPHDAWQQPLLRLADTMVGVAIGVACKWIASSLFDSFVEEAPR